MARGANSGYTYMRKIFSRINKPMAADELLAAAGPTAALYGITEDDIGAVLAVMINKDKVFALRRTDVTS